MLYLIGGAVAIIVLLILATGNGGKLMTLLGGFIGSLINDQAKTPKGAAALYDKQIEIAKENYRKINDAYREFAGIVSTAENNLKKAEEEFSITDSRCRSLVAAGNMEDATELADELTLIKAKIATYQKQVSDFTPKRDNAERLNAESQKTIRKLQQDKKLNVQQLKLDLETKKVYDSMDGLKAVNNLDKLMAQVEEGVQTAAEQAEGARVVHDAKHETKMARIEDNSRKAETQAYLEKLKAELNK